MNLRVSKHVEYNLKFKNYTNNLKMVHLLCLYCTKMTGDFYSLGFMGAKWESCFRKERLYIRIGPHFCPHYSILMGSAIHQASYHYNTELCSRKFTLMQ
jgi:hypothetical protein